MAAPLVTPAPRVLARKLRRIANEVAELPGLRLVARPLYRRWFAGPRGQVNIYHGVYDSHEAALADAPPSRPSHYDVDATGRMYKDRFDSIRVSDYPLVHWLDELFARGERRLFDLGGHTGVSYYGFRRYVDYPPDLEWLIHDTPAAIRAGREIAGERDLDRRLRFTERREDAENHDILLAAGVLQYLDYTLPELLGGLRCPPRHVLVNLTPMHEARRFDPLQHIGIAVLPYRIDCAPDFVAAMEAAGYRLVDRWESFERQLRIPFAPELLVDRYYGFYFVRA